MAPWAQMRSRKNIIIQLCAARSRRVCQKKKTTHASLSLSHCGKKRLFAHPQLMNSRVCAPVRKSRGSHSYHDTFGNSWWGYLTKWLLHQQRDPNSPVCSHGPPFFFRESQTDLWPRHIYFFQLNASRGLSPCTLTHIKSPGAKLTHHNKTTNYNQWRLGKQFAARVAHYYFCLKSAVAKLLKTAKDTADAKTHSPRVQ